MTDPLRICANGLPTVATARLMQFLKDYCSREKVDLLVMGHPRTLSGEESESMNYIRPFLGRLRKEIPSLPVEMFDERFTSTIAHREMISAGVPRKDRRDKSLADKTAAVIILTGWLESRQHN